MVKELLLGSCGWEVQADVVKTVIETGAIHEEELSLVDRSMYLRSPSGYVYATAITEQFILHISSGEHKDCWL